ncbi:hypothetical protein PAXRUDRAFT_613716 [Paxillus rubicundulus Ve08.2h10]|uniref:Thioredoxin n=1 Tax=Paxillus rubicundulus Ve08.2h10 TaxID=930991 RepID=A0A0D0EC88_9AGAM|nr:hypothetical protein PAXRUDRAFT_613716 [Paxillus rubicundulus Ve08.2h10]
MSVQDIKSKAHFDELITSGKTIFIDFHATWCGPCKFISPVFEKLAEKHEGDKVEFYKVDIDDQPEVAEAASITAMPTFKAYKDGEVVDSLTGANQAGLNALVQNHVPETK